MKSISSPTLPRPRTLALSDQVYRGLLAAYPPEFRRRYGPEMAQVFRTSCRATYTVSGSGGVVRLWLPTLWDWAWTAARERYSSLFRRSGMDAVISFDRQMGDLVWSIVTGLRAAYSLPQVIEVLALNAPEPTASALKRLDADLKAGLSLEVGLANLQKAIPSQHLAQVVAAIQEQRKSGGNLADLLEQLVDKIIKAVGSDGEFYPAMRQEAENLGAPVPERAREK